MKKFHYSAMIRNCTLLFFTIIILGCATSRELNHPTTYATLWVQNAAEYDALATMTYRTASSNLDLAFEDSYWSAALEQAEPYFNLPPAVVLDVDETVLDNSAFQARMIKRNSSFEPDAWTQWVREATADPVPGALEFTKYASQKGILVFYVTNREHTVEEATRKNLRKFGFPLADSVDVVLTQNERASWTSDKKTRREFLANDYRILMIFGDDLNDFVSAKGISMEQRDKLVEENQSKWGKFWYILPNPVYGSWEQALYDFNSFLDQSDREELMLQQLNPENPEN